MAVVSKGILSQQSIYSAGLEISPNCVCCIGERQTLDCTFFHCKAVVLLSKFREYDLHAALKVFVLEASSFCSNEVPSLTNVGHDVFLCLISVTKVVIWKALQNESYGGENSTYFQPILFFKHQREVKIRTERRRLSPLEFGKRWVAFASSCRVRGDDLQCHFDVC